MRWFVEISSLGNKHSASTTLCVEATQWQPALQKARILRGDEGALSNFSIELLDDGFRAIDPATRLRYTVKRAPDDAPLSNGARVKPDSEPPAAEAEPLPKKRAIAQTMAFTSTGAAAVFSERAPAVTEPELPSFEIVSQREEVPSERSPLNYREIVYAVPNGTKEEDAKRLILERFEHVKSTLDQARSGRLINLAIFDHRFKGKPLRRPIVTLTWKDWKGDAPEILFPLRSGPSTPPSAPASSTAQSAPPPAPVSPVAATAPEPAPVAPAPPPEPAPAAAVEAGPETPAPLTPSPSTKASPSTDRASAAPLAPASADRKSTPTPDRKSAPAAERKSTPAPAVAKEPSPPPQVKKPAKAQKRLSGEDLITELFESFGDLHFLRDSLEGAEFVLMLTLEKLPSEVGMVSLFDINKREFVVVRQIGGARSALCQRQPERAALATTAMRKRHAVVVADADGASRASDDRWTAIGVELRSLICAPVDFGGRYLGLIELANPLDGAAFNEGDGNALTYIGGQFAEFVASRGVIIDADLIMKSAEPAPAKKSR